MATIRSACSGRTFWVLWAAGAVAWITLMILAVSWDLPLSAAVADPSSGFGKTVALGGEWPAWVVVIVAIGMLAAGYREGSRLRPWRPLALAVIILAILEPLVVTQSLKFLWGRVRFRNLGPGFEGFTPFYWPAGPGAGESFPSGHTAMAFAVTPVAFFLTRTRGWLVGTAVWVTVLAYGLLVAWGRILAGAHYLTDCLFSIGLSLLLAAWLVRRLVRNEGS